MIVDNPQKNNSLVSLPQLRIQAMDSIIIAHKPTVPIDYLTKYLSFESNKACIKWLRSHGGAGINKV